MGSFSWNRADDTDIENVAFDSEFKFLIPKKFRTKEFSNGFIKDVYQNYGLLGTKVDGTPRYDMYELLAFWNSPNDVKYDGKFPLLKEIDKYTDLNRDIGIDIGCYDEQIVKLQFPLKLVSPECTKSYEEIKSPSYGDPDQGFFERQVGDEDEYDNEDDNYDEDED